MNNNIQLNCSFVSGIVGGVVGGVILLVIAGVALFIVFRRYVLLNNCTKCTYLPFLICYKNFSDNNRFSIGTLLLCYFPELIGKL